MGKVTAFCLPLPATPQRADGLHMLVVACTRQASEMQSFQTPCTQAKRSKIFQFFRSKRPRPRPRPKRQRAIEGSRQQSNRPAKQLKHEL